MPVTPRERGSELQCVCCPKGMNAENTNGEGLHSFDVRHDVGSRDEIPHHLFGLASRLLHQCAVAHEPSQGRHELDRRERPGDNRRVLGDPPRPSSTCGQRVVWLRDGRVVANGPAAEVVRAFVDHAFPGQPQTAAG